MYQEPNIEHDSNEVIVNEAIAPQNQCDGCLRGLPINEHGHHEEHGHPVMACTAHVYEVEDEDAEAPIEVSKFPARVLAFRNCLNQFNPGDKIEWNGASGKVVESFGNGVRIRMNSGAKFTAFANEAELKAA